MSSFKSFDCGCGVGRVYETRGPGRFYQEFFGAEYYSVPDDFPIPTCDECGEQYLMVEAETELQRRLGITD